MNQDRGSEGPSSLTETVYHERLRLYCAPDFTRFSAREDQTEVNILCTGRLAQAVTRSCAVVPDDGPSAVVRG